jgi:hypothetical protein
MLLDPQKILREPSPDEWERVALYAPLIKMLGFHRFGCCQHSLELLEPKVFHILSWFQEDFLPNLRGLKWSSDLYPHLSVFFRKNVKFTTVNWMLRFYKDAENIPFVKSLEVTSWSLQSLEVGVPTNVPIKISATFHMIFSKLVCSLPCLRFLSCNALMRPLYIWPPLQPLRACQSGMTLQISSIVFTQLETTLASSHVSCISLCWTIHSVQLHWCT